MTEEINGSRPSGEHTKRSECQEGPLCVCVCVCGGSTRGLEQCLKQGCSLSSSCVQVPATGAIKDPETKYWTFEGSEPNY